MYSNIHAGYNNDLWKYNASTGQWTWMSGDGFADVPGIYGEKGISDAASKLGKRNSVLSWRGWYR